MRLTIESVSKRYRGDVWALSDFSLTLEPGVLGLLGPNGAGKSTLMRIVATVTRPTSGRVVWDGVDIGCSPDAVRSVLGYLPQDFGVYPHLNAQEFLEYLAAVKGLDGRSARRRIDELLELLGLLEVRRRPLGGYSGGMKQRVGIAQALLNDPRLLIVDEPTVGLDPEERMRFRGLLADLAGDRIVILSTHIVPDVEATATTIALIHRGRLLQHAARSSSCAPSTAVCGSGQFRDVNLPALKARHVVSGTTCRSEGMRVRVAVCDECPAAEAVEVVPTRVEDAYLDVLSRAKGAVPGLEAEGHPTVATSRRPVPHGAHRLPRAREGIRVPGDGGTHRRGWV